MDQQPFIVREVALRADDTVLELLSHIPTLWSIIRPELASQFWWYQRTAEAFELPATLEWDKTSKLNWHQIYNILVATRTGNPFDVVTDSRRRTRDRTAYSAPSLPVLSLNGYNITAIKLLLEWGYRPNESTLVYVASYGTLEALLLLLGEEEISYSTLSQLVENSASEGNEDVLKYLLQDSELGMKMIQR
ncbi:Hypothetical protein POVR2_LOCUS331 [uncultured virus]|nr:Hypothetical protein POVR2_LOCUS331 [uncultured virus]